MYEQQKKRRCHYLVDGKKFPGWFHGWGSAVIYFDGVNGDKIPVAYTIGIVEDNEGNIHQVEPENLKFNV